MATRRPRGAVVPCTKPPPRVVVDSARVRALRRAARLSQMHLAELAGLTPEAISKLERDKVRPHLDTVQKIAAVLGVPWLELFRPEDEAPDRPA